MFKCPNMFGKSVDFFCLDKFQSPRGQVSVQFYHYGIKTQGQRHLLYLINILDIKLSSH